MKEFNTKVFKNFVESFPVYEIYKKDIVKAPEGFEFTGEFREVNKDWFLNSNGYEPLYCDTLFGSREKNYRLILKPVKSKVIKFTETGEVRPPKIGEYYKYKDCFVKAPSDFTDNTSNYFPIYNVVEV